MPGRRPLSSSPAAPPASVEEGAARVTDFTVKLHDRQDGQGINWPLLAKTLFLAAFELLDKLPDDQRRLIALRVHDRSYDAATRSQAGDLAAGKTNAIGSVPAPSNATPFKSAAPRPPGVGR